MQHELFLFSYFLLTIISLEYLIRKVRAICGILGTFRDMFCLLVDSRSNIDRRKEKRKEGGHRI